MKDGIACTCNKAIQKRFNFIYKRDSYVYFMDSHNFVEIKVGEEMYSVLARQ